MKSYREPLLAFMRSTGGRPVRFREIASMVDASRGDRAAVRELVNELLADGELVRLKGGVFAWAGGSTLLTGRLSVHRDGFGFVSPPEGDDIFIPARHIGGAMHGDLVEIRKVGRPQRGSKAEGRIVRVVERAHEKLVGVFLAGKRAGTVRPAETRLANDILVPLPVAGGAQDGQVVHVEITSYPMSGKPAMGKVVEVLGWPDDPEVEVQTVIRKYDLPHEFAKDVLAEARKTPQHVTDGDREGRVDLRTLTTVTIDGETARDFDDAVSIAREVGGIRLWVSIADVSNYVKPGSPLDREAYLRGTSVYFPDRCIPMLPEELSNGICSLNPQVERLAMTAEMLFDSAGTMQESKFYPSVILSNARLTYTIVKKIVVDNDPEAIATHSGLVGDLRIMEELALCLTAKRRKRGSIDFDLPEPQIILDVQGRTEAIIRSERNLAHRIIEEFMLAANEAVAGFLTDTGYPCLYRIHEQPDPAKLSDFKEFVASFGYEFALEEGKVKPSELQRLLDQAEGKPEERMINEVLLRAMKQARYSADNVGHFGLAADCYAHFTSPIRRYPDLVVHRILRDALRKKEYRDSGRLPDVALHTSSRERVAMEAERELVELKKLQFMKDKVGEEYDGIITGVAAFGLFVELNELFVEGLIHIAMLPQDFYRYDEKFHLLQGENSRTQYRIGDSVRIRVAAVGIERRQIDFVLASMPASVSPYEEERYDRRPVKGKPLPGKLPGRGERGKPMSGGKGKGGNKGRGKRR